MTTLQRTGKTRQQRKQAQKVAWADRATYEREHPILSGAVKVVDYVPPKGTYTPAILPMVCPQ